MFDTPALWVDPDEDLIRAFDSSHERACRSQRRMLAIVAELDRKESWRDSGLEI